MNIGGSMNQIEFEDYFSLNKELFKPNEIIILTAPITTYSNISDMCEYVASTLAGAGLYNKVMFKPPETEIHAWSKSQLVDYIEYLEGILKE